MSIEILDERNEMETNNTKTLDVNWKKLAHYIRNHGINPVCTKQNPKHPEYIIWEFENTARTRELIETFRLFYGRVF